jgi:hypothetical protein
MRYVAILVVLLAVLLPAQYTRRRGPASATATTGPYSGPAVSFNGTLKSISKKDFVLDLDPADSQAEQQSLTFRFSKKTKFMKGDQAIKPTDLAVGTHLSLDATRDGDLKLSAVSVFVVAPEKAADK